jgi:hypothetical protein
LSDSNNPGYDLHQRTQFIAGSGLDAALSKVSGDAWKYSKELLADGPHAPG